MDQGHLNLPNKGWINGPGLSGPQILSVKTLH